MNGNRKVLIALLSLFTVTFASVAIGQIARDVGALEFDLLAKEPTRSQGFQQLSLAPVIRSKELYSHKIHSEGVSLTVQEIDQAYLVTFSPHVPSGKWSSSLVDPKVIGHVSMSYSYLGIEFSHPVTQIGTAFVAQVPKSSFLPGTLYDLKVLSWEPGTDWSEEDDAFYSHMATLGFL